MWLLSIDVRTLKGELVQTIVTSFMSKDKAKLRELFRYRTENELCCSGMYATDFGLDTECNDTFMYVAEYTEVEEI